MDNLTDFVAPGTDIKEFMFQAAPNVSIRVVTFSPEKPTTEPEIVFVAGWITRMMSWKDVLPELTKTHTVHYVETREKITADVKGKAEYSVEVMGLDIVRFIEQKQYKTGEYILFGSSLGATSILDAHRHLKQHPLCYILVGPNAVFRMPKFANAWIRAFFPPAYFVLRPALKWYLRTFRMDTEADYAQYEKYCGSLDAADPWKLRKAALALAKYTVWDLLADIQTPTLVVGASKDSLHEPKNLIRIVEMMPNATYLDMETNAGSHSKAMVDEIHKFLNTLDKK